MEAKLRSILKRIHWSLVLRAAVFALAWLWLPFWVFFLLSFYLYLIPFFRPGKLAIPFSALLLLTFIQPPGALVALVFGAMFYAILLIKDLLLIDRRSAHELITLALSFLLLRDFYMKFNEGIGGPALFYSFLTAVVLGLLMLSYMGSSHEDDAAIAWPMERTAIWLSFLFLWQILIAGLFLPLDFIYQSVVVFLVVVLLIDLVPEHIFGGLSKTKTLMAASVIFALFVIVLGSARWGL